MVEIKKDEWLWVKQLIVVLPLVFGVLGLFIVGGYILERDFEDNEEQCAEAVNELFGLDGCQKDDKAVRIEAFKLCLGRNE